MEICVNEIITAAKEEVKNKKTRAEFMLQEILKHAVINIALTNDHEIGKEFVTTYSCHHLINKELSIGYMSYSAMYTALIKKELKIDQEVLHSLGLATLEFTGSTLNCNSSSFVVSINYSFYNKED